MIGGAVMNGFVKTGIFISLCISMPSAVKQKGGDAVKVEITFNHREHGEHRDTRRIFYLVFIPDFSVYLCVLCDLCG
jgi:hypothetical protein